MGSVNNARLMAYLVSVLTWKDFSVNWLTENNVKSIECTWKKLEFAKKLKDVAVSIWDDYNEKVPENLDSLLSILGIKSCSACLTLQYAFNPLNVSFVTMVLLFL